MKEIYEIIQLKNASTPLSVTRSPRFTESKHLYIFLINFSVFPPTRLFFPEHLFVFSAHYLQPAVELQP